MNVRLIYLYLSLCIYQSWTSDLQNTFCKFDILKLQCSTDCCYTEGKCFPCKDVGRIPTAFNLSNIYSNWMKKLTQHSRKKQLHLKDIILPGIHHAGIIWEDVEEIEIIKNWTVTQIIPINNQLNGGIRFFDIRLAYQKDEIVTVHASDLKDIKVFGLPLLSILNSTMQFLESNEDESVVWLLRWNYGIPRWSKVKEILRHAENYVLMNGTSFLLDDVKGKIIICENRYLSKYGVLKNCQGSWDETDTPFPEVLTEKIYTWATTSKLLNEYYFIEAVCTPTLESIVEGYFMGYKSLKDLAEFCNYSIFNQLLSRFMNFSSIQQLIKQNNAVFMDFSNPTMVNQLIQYNFDMYILPQIQVVHTSNVTEVLTTASFTIVRPILKASYCFLGDTILQTLQNFNVSTTLILKIDSNKVFTSGNFTMLTKGGHNETYWQPVCKEHFTNLGLIVSPNDSPPSDQRVCCLDKELLTIGNWYTPKISSDLNFVMNVPLNEGYAFLTPVISIKNSNVQYPYSIRKSVVTTKW